MITRPYLLLCLFLFLSAASSESATIRYGVLENGFQIHIQADEDLALTTVSMFFAAGRATDPDSLAGLAHLAEHLLTESCESLPDGELARQSALYSTYSNAYTRAGSVEFETQCLPQFLKDVLVLEVKRLGGGGIDENSFEREKSVVLEELAYRRRLSPFYQHLERLQQACYRGHPFGEKIAGTSETVGRIQLADYEAFCRDYIRPPRAALVIRGPVDLDLTYNLADSLFTIGTRSQSEFIEVPDFPPVRLTQVVSDDIGFDGVRVSVGSRVPLDSYENAAFVRSLGAMLETSRLGIGVGSVPGEALVYLNTFFRYNKPPQDKARHWGYLYQDFDPDQDAQHALGYIWKQLDEELEDLQDNALYEERRHKALAEPLTGNVGTLLVGGYRALKTEKIVATLAEMPQDKFQALADQYLSPAHGAVGVTHGRDSERQQAIDLATRVERGAEIHGDDALAELTAEDIQPVLEAYQRAGLEFVTITSLSNGLPVMYLELPGTAKVRMGGCRALPPLKVQRQGDKPGITHLYGSVVTYDDRQRRTAEKPKYRPKDLPFELDLHLDPGALEYSVAGPSDKTPRMAFHLARRLNSPEFNQEKWFLVSDNGRDYLERTAARPVMIARGWRWEQIFGSDYQDLGFFRPQAKTAEKTKYKDLVKLHKDVAGRSGQTVLFGAGDLPADEFVAALKKEFAGRDYYRDFTGPSPKVVIETGTPGRVVTELGRADVRLTLTFPPVSGRRKVDLAKVLLLETLLDQTLTGRLRENEGLTYSVFVMARPLSGLTLWEMQVTCQPGQAPLVLRVTREELTKITASGFSPDELARARLALTGRLIRLFNDQDDGFELLAQLGLFGGMPPDLLGRIAGLDAAAINAMAARVVSPDRFAFTAVGPMFEEDIEQFDLH